MSFSFTSGVVVAVKSITGVLGKCELRSRSAPYLGLFFEVFGKTSIF